MGWEGPALLMAHAQAAPNLKQPATDTDARNLAFAVQERIAYASLCSVSERIEYRERVEDAVGQACSPRVGDHAWCR